MVSKGSSQNMGVFGIVNSHEARLMKPLGKPQKRSYSMPGKTGYPQSPWCLQYLAGDFQQQIWDDPHRPLFLGWVEVISHGRRISPWHKMIVAWFSCWRVRNLPTSFPVRGIRLSYFWLSWQAYQKSPVVCLVVFTHEKPHWNPLQPGMPQEGMEWFGDLSGAGNGNLPTKPQWMWEQKEYQGTSHPHQLLEVY